MLARRLLCLTLASLFSAATPAPAVAESLTFHAAQSGKETLDQGEGGGNPFASALIELLGRPQLSLGEMTLDLARLTKAKSGGFQSADVPNGPSLQARQHWSVSPASPAERRIALVLVVTDYSRSGGAPSLLGAKHDAARVVAALREAGFATELALDLDLKAMRAKLADFASRAQAHDAAILYTTGHGVEVDGKVYLLPGDYPISERNGALNARALRLDIIAAAARAKSVNLVFYGGCRDNPFGN